jgi:hypothetical protein
LAAIYPTYAVAAFGFRLPFDCVTTNGGMVLLILCIRFYRAQRGKTEYQQN